MGFPFENWVAQSCTEVMSAMHGHLQVTREPQFANMTEGGHA